VRSHHRTRHDLIDAGPSIQQQRHDAGMSSLGGCDQWIAVAVRRNVRIGSAVQQVVTTNPMATIANTMRALEFIA
jgi:hypothetical protein